MASKMEVINVHMRTSDLDALERFRHRGDGAMTRAEALRVAVRKGLQALGVEVSNDRSDEKR